jgi:hypothetical protein
MHSYRSIPVSTDRGPAVDRTRRAAGVSVAGPLKAARTSPVAIAVTIVGFVAYCVIELTHGRYVHGTGAAALDPGVPGESSRRA